MDEQTKYSIGKAFSALRQKFAHTCQGCGKVFVANNTAKFCATACRSKAWRQRKLGRQTTA